MINKRGINIGTYDTAIKGWTLAGLTFSDPVTVTNIVDVPGRRKGPLDLSAALTDGDPVYGNRTLTAVFECSEGTREDREEIISEMINELSGYIHNIKLPDDSKHYITGRVSVARLYNDLAHGSVQVTATCEPWRYAKEETKVMLECRQDVLTATLPNQGRLAVVPSLTVIGGEVALIFDGATHKLSPGTYALPDLLLPRGGKKISYNGVGVVVLTYREAIL